MKIDSDLIKYLKGDIFSNTQSFQIRRERHPDRSREAAIIEIIKGHSVIHVGCADHLPLIEEKIRTNRWLHKLITDASSGCIGIDIDKEAITYIRDKLGIKNVIPGDILNDNLDEINREKWDYVVFGEIIEHLDNPVEFLRIFKNKYGDTVKKFIITVPSIFNLSQIRNIRKYREVINTDHRFWFTPYTILKVLVRSGYSPEKILYSNRVKLSLPALMIRKIRIISGCRVNYPYYYFNTMVVTGNV